MNLNDIRIAANAVIDDDEILALCMALWEAAPRPSRNAMRSYIEEALIKGTDIDLPKRVFDAFYANPEKLCDAISDARALTVKPGADSFAKFYFLTEKLGVAPEKADPLFQKALEEGNKEAVLCHASIVLDDKEASDTTKLMAARNAVDILGKKHSGHLLAGAYLMTGDYKGFVKAAIEGAKAGNVECSYYAAKFYEAKKEFEKAKLYFENGRYSIDPNAYYEYACTFIGKRYGRVDMEKGEALMIEAMKRGSAEAAAHLGKSYLWAESYADCNHDMAKAVKYLEEADRLGHSDAGFFLGCIYDGDYGIEDGFCNKEKAIRCWERLAKKNHGDSLMEIGCAYYNGDHGYDKNEQLAWAYFKEAAIHGSTLGATYCGDMIAQLEVSGTKEMAIDMFVRGMSAYDEDTRDFARDRYAKAYRAGKLFSIDEGWAKTVESFKIEYQGNNEKTYNWIKEKLNAKRDEYVAKRGRLN